MLKFNWDIYSFYVFDINITVSPACTQQKCDLCNGSYEHKPESMK